MTDVLILCGGYGTRLRGYLPSGYPKALADVNGRPFIDVLLDHLRGRGFERFILCTGYGGELLVQHLWEDLTVRFSSEGYRPRGTCRAILQALPKVKSDPFLVLNGDTFCALDLHDLIARHNAHDKLVTVPVQGDTPVGAFAVNRNLFTFHPCPAEGSNLEDLLAKAGHHVHRYQVAYPYYDIGTPAGLERFRREWATLLMAKA